MENKFLDSLKNESNKKLTENGAEALGSTLSGLMDFFATSGALRSRPASEVCELFEKAYAEDSLLALKALFYTRNIRGGLGERDTFRKIIKYLAENHTAEIRANFDNIVTFGRFDDLYAFEGTRLEKDAFDYLKKIFDEDINYLHAGEIHKISLLAKWLKSVNASSKETCRLGKLTAKYFDKTERIYRKQLKALRAALEIVETKMSAGEWDKIDYSKLPSLAALKYRAAFYNKDEERYKQYLESLKKGEAKVNTATLYPYDLIRPYINRDTDKVDDLIESQWKNLPNYVTDDKKFLIMADVSGSMYGTPMCVSVSLAMYFAQRNTGIFHNKFLTFSSKPTFVELSDSATLFGNTNFVMNADWGMNTDLYKAFKLVLNAAINGKVKQSELPDALVVITDMEIDYAGSGNKNFTEQMAKEFEAAGYKMPTLVWWNVNARQNTFHAEYNDDRVRFISGCSAAVFKGLCEKMGNTPMELMLAILNDPIYDCVKLA